MDVSSLYQPRTIEDAARRPSAKPGNQPDYRSFTLKGLRGAVAPGVPTGPDGRVTGGGFTSALNASPKILEFLQSAPPAADSFKDAPAPHEWRRQKMAALRAEDESMTRLDAKKAANELWRTLSSEAKAGAWGGAIDYRSDMTLAAANGQTDTPPQMWMRHTKNALKQTYALYGEEPSGKKIRKEALAAWGKLDSAHKAHYWSAAASSAESVRAWGAQESPDASDKDAVWSEHKSVIRAEFARDPNNPEVQKTFEAAYVYSGDAVGHTFPSAPEGSREYMKENYKMTDFLQSAEQRADAVKEQRVALYEKMKAEGVPPLERYQKILEFNARLPAEYGDSLQGRSKSSDAPAPGSYKAAAQARLREFMGALGKTPEPMADIQIDFSGGKAGKAGGVTTLADAVSGAGSSGQTETEKQADLIRKIRDALAEG